jgi:hypothetical protein
VGLLPFFAISTIPYAFPHVFSPIIYFILPVYTHTHTHIHIHRHTHWQTHTVWRLPPDIPTSFVQPNTFTMCKHIWVDIFCIQFQRGRAQYEVISESTKRNLLLLHSFIVYVTHTYIHKIHIFCTIKYQALFIMS